MHVYYTPTVHRDYYESLPRCLPENRSSYYIWKAAMFR